MARWVLVEADAAEKDDVGALVDEVELEQELELGSRLDQFGDGQRPAPRTLRFAGPPTRRLGAIALMAQITRIRLKPCATEWSDAQRPFESHFIAFEWKDRPPDLPLHVRDTKGRIRQIILWLYADRDSHSSQAPTTSIAHLQTLIAEYRSAAERRDPERELVAAIHGYIHDRLTEKITLADLARRASLSKYHFLRTYQALTRRTPMEAVRAIRLRRAQELILGTNLPLKEVAVRCGLGNEYLLSRLFRTYFDIPPGEMRRGRRK